MTQHEFQVMLEMFKGYEDANKEAHANILAKIAELCRNLRTHEEREITEARHCREAVMAAIDEARRGAIAEATKPTPLQLVLHGAWGRTLQLLGVVATSVGIAVAVVKLVGS